MMFIYHEGRNKAAYVTYRQRQTDKHTNNIKQYQPSQNMLNHL